jgi:hypothetical protein
MRVAFYLSPDTRVDFLEEVLERSDYVLAVSSGAAEPALPKSFTDEEQVQAAISNLYKLPSSMSYVKTKASLHLMFRRWRKLSTVQFGFFLDSNPDAKGLHADTTKRLHLAQEVDEKDPKFWLEKRYRVTDIRDAVAHLFAFEEHPERFPTDGTPVTCMTDVDYSRAELWRLLKEGKGLERNIVNEGVDQWVHLMRYTSPAQVLDAMTADPTVTKRLQF